MSVLEQLFCVANAGCQGYTLDIALGSPPRSISLVCLLLSWQGYLRRGNALEALLEYHDALRAYKEGLSKDPKDEGLVKVNSRRPYSLCPDVVLRCPLQLVLCCPD